jgi:hypothetical protein
MRVVESGKARALLGLEDPVLNLLWELVERLRPADCVDQDHVL